MQKPAIFSSFGTLPPPEGDTYSIKQAVKQESWLKTWLDVAVITKRMMLLEEELKNPRTMSLRTKRKVQLCSRCGSR
jgi:hypothetical protein